MTSQNIPKSWFVIHPLSGRIDGYYSDKRCAEGQLNFWKEMLPLEIFELHSKPRNEKPRQRLHMDPLATLDFCKEKREQSEFHAEWLASK